MKPLLDLLQAFEAGVFVTLIFGFGIYAGWNLHKSFRPRRITWRRKKFVSTDGVERSGVGAVQPGNRTRPVSMEKDVVFDFRSQVSDQVKADAISALHQLGYSRFMSHQWVKQALIEGAADFESIMRLALSNAPQRTTNSNSLRD